MYWQVVEWPESHAGMAEGLAGMKEMTGTQARFGEGMAEGLAGRGLALSAA